MVTVGGEEWKGWGRTLAHSWLTKLSHLQKKKAIKARCSFKSSHIQGPVQEGLVKSSTPTETLNTTALQRSTEVWSSSSNHSYDKISVRGCKFNLNLKNADLWTGKLKWMKTFFTQMCITLKTIMRKQWGSAMSPARDSSHPSANLQRKRKNDDAWWNLA